MKNISHLFFKILLPIYILYPPEIQHCFAIECEWIGTENNQMSHIGEQWKLWLSGTNAQTTFEGVKGFLDFEGNWRGPIPGTEDTGIFSDNSRVVQIHLEQKGAPEFRVGRFLFKGSKTFHLSLLNGQTFSFVGEGVTTEDDNSPVFHIGGRSTLNFLNQSRASAQKNPVHYELNESNLCFDDEASANNAIIGAKGGTIVFKDKSSLGTAQLDLTETKLIFENDVKGDNAKVYLFEGSELIISQNNALNSLQTNADATIKLGKYELSLGSNTSVDHKDSIAGSLEGDTNSRLIKKGEGTLCLDGNNSNFHGETSIESGEVNLNSHLKGKVVVKENGFLSGSGEVCNLEVEGKITSRGNTRPLNIKGKAVFKGRSSLISASLALEKGELELHNDVSGRDSTIALVDGSHLFLHHDNAIGSLKLDASSSLNLFGNTLKVGEANQDDQIMGKIEGSTSSKFVKGGTGTLTLGFDNRTFQGQTEVLEGSLALNNHIGGDILVKDSGTLVITKNGIVHKTITIDTGGSLTSEGDENEIMDVRGDIQFINKSSSTGCHFTVSNKVIFSDTSEAGSAVIKAVNKGEVHFIDKSQARNAEISLADNAKLIFENTASASEAKIVLDDASSIIFSENTKVSVGSLTSNGSETRIRLLGESGSTGAFVSIGMRGDDDVIKGVIEGSKASQIRKTGPGALTLTNNNSGFEGDVVIDDGKLVVNNFLGSNIRIESSGLLCGNGTVLGDVTVDNGGCLLALDHRDNDKGGGGKLILEGNVNFIRESSAGSNEYEITKEIKFSGNSEADNATINVLGQGKAIFEDSADPGSARITLQSESRLELRNKIDDPERVRSTVILKGSATLSLVDEEDKKIETALGSIDTDKGTTIDLGNYGFLTIGQKGIANTIEGELLGGVKSTLTKEGTEKLHLIGDKSAFNGILNIDQGEVRLGGGNTSLGGTVFIKKSGKLTGNGSVNNITVEEGGAVALIDESENKEASANNIMVKGDICFKNKCELDRPKITISNKITFSDNSKAGNASLTLKREGDAGMPIAIFEGESTASSAEINLRENSRLEFLGQAKGDCATVTLAKDAKLTINQDNTLKILKTEDGSSIELNDYRLTLGKDSSELTNSTLGGQLKGGERSELIKSGKGTLTITGENSQFNGTTTVDEGTTELRNVLGGKIVVNEAGTLVVHSSIPPTNKHIKVGGNMSFTEYAEAQTASIDVYKSLIFAGNARGGRATIHAYKGEVTFDQNSNAQQANITLSDQSKLTFNDQSEGYEASVELRGGSKLIICKKDHELGSLDAEGDTIVDLKQFNLIIGGNNINNTVSGTIMGGKDTRLIKKGAGTLTLNGNNTDYDGTIEIRGGTTVFENCLGGNLLVCGSGILTGSGTVKKSLTIDTGGILATDHTAALNVEGEIHFKNQANAGTAKIDVSTSLHFSDEAHAGEASIYAKNANIYFKDKSHAGSANLNLSEGSEIKFLDTACGDSADIHLQSNSWLDISANNSLGSLTTDETSRVELNDFTLSLGNHHSESHLKGQLHGTSSSKLIKTGKGKLFFDSDNLDYAGQTVVDEGTLVLNHTLGGHVIINKGGTFQSLGKVLGDVKANEESIIALDDNLGTLYVHGNYQQDKNSTLRLKSTNEGDCSFIHVMGSANLQGGKVSLSDFALCHPYKILHAEEGLEGKYETSPISNSYIKQKFVYKKNDVYLLITPDLAAAVATPNQKHTARQIDNIHHLSEENMEIVKTLISSSQKDVETALDQMSGEQYGNFLIASQRATEQFFQRIYTPLRLLSLDEDHEDLCFNRCKFWGDTGANQSYHKGEKGCEIDSFYLTLAAQRTFNDWLAESECLTSFFPYHWLTGWTFGIACSYERENFDFHQGGQASMNNIQGALYALLTRSWYYFLFDVGFGNTTGTFKRPIKIAHIHLKAHSEPSIFQSSFYAEWGLNNLCYFSVSLQPFLGLEIGQINLSRIKESGAKILDLEIDEHTANFTNSYLGLHAYKAFGCDCSWGLAADIAWKHLFDFDDQLRERFAHFGDSFTISRSREGRDGFLAALTLYKAVTDHWTVSGEFSGEKCGDVSHISFTANALYRW